MTIPQSTYRSISELAAKPPSSKAFHKIFNLNSFNPACRTSPELQKKYGVPTDNVQEVVAIQNLATYDITWWNPARATKPQNFKSDGAIIDPTGGGGPGRCDFCSWETLTAEDTFGRVEGPYAVSASNLFKYSAPSQGVVVFKHHDPLEFNLAQLKDLLTVANGWFERAAASAAADASSSSSEAETAADFIGGYGSNGRSSAASLHPMLVWNCLSRAGASQFHGHAQTLLSALPFPAVQREFEAAARYAAAHSNADYFADLTAAHACVELTRRLEIDVAKSNGSFSSTVVSRDASPPSTAAAAATAFASLCPTKDAEMVVHGASLACPAFQTLFYAALRGLIDGLGVKTFNAGIVNIPIQRNTGDNIVNSSVGSRYQYAGPVVARVVSRGLSSAASDFGGLEVFGGAAIGRTDPWSVIAAVDKALEAVTSPDQAWQVRRG